MDEARGLLWAMRTGKSRVIIRSAFALAARGKCDGMIVVAPNGVHLNWSTYELPAHAPGAYRALAWRSGKTKPDESLAFLLDRKAFRVLCVNIEALLLERVRNLIGEFTKQTRTMLVVDEADEFGRPGTKRAFYIRGLAKRCAFRRILTGSCITNGHRKAFTQFEILRPGALGVDTLKDFDKLFSYAETDYSSGRPLVKHKPRNMPLLQKRMAALCSVVTREEADLPELIPITRLVEMSEAQEAAYRSMAQDMLIELDSGDLEVFDGAARVMKLQQVLGGFAIDEQGDVQNIDDSPPILDALVRECRGTLPGKFVVWCRFREDIRRVCKRLRAEGFDVVEYHGGVADGAREAGLKRLREDPFCDGLVGNPQSAGKGRNMSAASTIIWYSQSPNATLRQQGEERATQRGGTSTAVVDLITAGTVAEQIREVNAGRIRLADAVAGKGLRDLLARWCK